MTDPNGTLIAEDLKTGRGFHGLKQDADHRGSLTGRGSTTRFCAHDAGLSSLLTAVNGHPSGVSPPAIGDDPRPVNPLSDQRLSRLVDPQRSVPIRVP